MEESKDQTLVDKVWGFFASIRLAVVLFALIGVTSIIGTIIEQNVEPEKNLRLIAKLFGNSIAPTLYEFFDKLGFMDMYHSLWFVALLVLFAVNLIICSLDRLPRILKLIKEPIKPLPEEQFKNMNRKEIFLKGKKEKIRDAVDASIKKIGFKPFEVKEAGGCQLYAEKGNYTRLGVYITHLSILLILIGALIGIFFGFKGFLELPEGESRTFVFLKTKMFSPMEESEIEAMLRALQSTGGNTTETAAHLGIAKDTLNAKLKRYGILPLGFGIRCDNFLVDFYGRSNMPKDYKSWLTVIENGKEARKKIIEVNDPLTYNGITFYQSSFGMSRDPHAEFILRITSKSGASGTRQMHINDKFTIAGTNLEGRIKDFSPALSFDAGGRPFTSAKQMNNPAILAEFSENGKIKYAGWIMKRYPETSFLPEGHAVELLDVWGVEYTGLQVRRDPGVWIVYLGCVAMGIGLYIAFFMSHKKLWVRLVDEKNSTRIIVAASANKNRPSFEAKVDKIISLLSKSVGGEKQ